MKQKLNERGVKHDVRTHEVSREGKHERLPISEWDNILRRAHAAKPVSVMPFGAAFARRMK